MVKTGTKVLLRSIALIFILLAHLNVFAQTVSEKIDISGEFKKIESYNEHIKSANNYRHAIQKRFWKDATLFLVGLSGAAGSAVLYTNAKEDDMKYVGAGVAGISLAIIYDALHDKGSYNRNAEEEALEKAKALFNIIPNNK